MMKLRISENDEDQLRGTYYDTSNNKLPLRMEHLELQYWPRKFTFLHCKTIVLRNYPYCFCKRCVCTKLKQNANFSFC